jgi:uncharacterized C2H2 Zn-finger protein
MKHIGNNPHTIGRCPQCGMVDRLRKNGLCEQCLTRQRHATYYQKITRQKEGGK